MAGNSGGPWGGGGKRGGNGGQDPQGPDRGGRRPGGEGGQQVPEIDELVRKGQEQLRVLIGGRGGGGGSGGAGSGGPQGPLITRGRVVLGVVLAAAAWFWASFYTVQPEEQGVELFLGKYYRTTDDGPHLAYWPFVTVEVIPTTREQTEDVGAGSGGSSATGLMLTTDENIIDVDFEIVWNINDPAKFLFNLAEPRETIRAVAESAMREVIAQRELAPIINRDREVVKDEALALIQTTLDAYDSGVNIIRLNLDRADPPQEVIDSFREVQAAEQERDRLERQADAYANRVLAGARGEAAQLLEQAQGYRAQVVNEAVGEASRFRSVLEEYAKAPEVTRKRLYLETMEQVLGRVDKIILDENGGGAGQGVVPYLPLNELRRGNGSGGTN